MCVEVVEVPLLSEDGDRGNTEGVMDERFTGTDFHPFSLPFLNLRKTQPCKRCNPCLLSPRDLPHGKAVHSQAQCDSKGFELDPKSVVFFFLVC